MSVDLLSIADLEPPMGDLNVGNRLDTARSIWTKKEKGEHDLPSKRIIHQRILRLHGVARLEKLGIRPSFGTHKCASAVDHDWVIAFRVRARVQGRWRVILEKVHLPKPRNNNLRWFSLKGIETDAVIVEIRRCGMDGGWTSWNLAMGAFELWGEQIDPIGPRLERRLQLEKLDLDSLPKGICAERVDGTIRYETEDFQIGFRLDRPALSFLSLGIEGPELKQTNLLLRNPIRCLQGPQLQLVGHAPLIASSVRCDIDGMVTIVRNSVRYNIRSGNQRYTYHWKILQRSISLKIVRESKRTETAWNSSVWSFAWANDTSPTHAAGHLNKEGETGALSLPSWVNAPGFGTLHIDSKDESVSLRSDCHRSSGYNLIELKVGEKVDKHGLHHLLAGRHEATVTFRPLRPPKNLKSNTPPVVKRALNRTYFVAPTFRPDLGTLSNNGASMGCPICADTWMAVLPHLDLKTKVKQCPEGTELLRVSIERILDDGPGYAAGVLSKNGKTHLADDEYLMTGAATLRAIGEYLHYYADATWYRSHRKKIFEKINLMKNRDLDDDGLIESPHRTGISDLGQWSTCWLDVLSFGWKCAWSNAILYGALGEMSQGLSRFKSHKRAESIRAWREQLKGNYRSTFWNEKTGWLAGWRCKEDRLHDYAFLPVNGTAIREGLLDIEEGRTVLSRLLEEANRVGMPDPEFGLPMNLWNIPDEDRADILQGYPFGYYQNGGRTHSQSRHLVMALYKVGMKEEADYLLERLCVGFAEASVFGGNQTGVDWRDWNDAPCGYEGLLTDQFGILEAIIYRWGK